jgi:hypothetical protein
LAEFTPILGINSSNNNWRLFQMSKFNYMVVLSMAQEDELEKIAMAPVGSWTGRLVGAGLGATAGGLYGYKTNPEDQRTFGAIKGAITGGVAGLAGGQVATKAGRGELQRFGQRQLHGLTGYLPGRGLLGRGPEGTKFWQLGAKTNITPAQRMEAMEKMKWNIPKARTQEEALKEMQEGGIGRLIAKTETGRKYQEGAARRAVAGEQAGREVIEQNMTNIPGLAKSYLGMNPNMSPVQALKTNIKAQGAMGLAIPTVFTGQAALNYAQNKDKPELVGSLGMNVPGLLAASTPMTTAIGLGTAAQMGSERIARGIQSLVNRRKAGETNV